jgi:hypothetical protein
MTTDEQERRIELAIAALRLIAVYTEEELDEARDRMRRVADDVDGVFRRVAERRIQEGSGP